MKTKMNTPSTMGIGLLAALTCLFPLQAWAGEQQTWLAVATNGPVQADSNWLYWFDGHARSQDDASGLGVSIIRPALGYKVSDKLSLWAGYARVVARRAGPDTEEHRIWQQATYPVADLFGGKLSGRTRLEQRLIEGAGDTGHRIRQFWRWSRPIQGTDWSWVLGNETFIAFNNTDFGQDSGYLQNRASLGFAWQAGGPRVEIGYLNNHIDRPGADNTNHNITLALFF